MWRSLGLVFLYVFVFVGVAFSSGPDAIPKNVTINKCCRIDEHLTKNYNFTCVNRPENWNFRLLEKNKQTVNTLPKYFLLKESKRPKCPTALRFTLNNDYVLLPNGSLFVPSLHGLNNERFFHPGQYCLDYTTALVCINPTNKTEIRRCCFKGQAFSRAAKECVNTKVQVDRLFGDDVAIATGFPKCPGGNHGIVGNIHRPERLENGSLLLNSSGKLLDPDSFCLEHVVDDPENITIFACHDLIPPVEKLKSPKDNDLRFTLYPIGLALSAIFLAATLATGFLLPASHHVLHWRCQTNHVLCLLIGDVLLCITQLTGLTIGESPCLIMSVAMYFWFLAAFFWLNTMCFNIWWTFRDLRPQSIEKSQERCRLRLYELYAWGIPLLMATSAIGLELASYENTLRPRFCQNNPWFGGNTEMLAYFIGPVGVLLVVNVMLFVATARELTCGLWKRELVKSTSESRAALSRVCLKLLVVMGITWIMDVISWFVGGPKEIWYLSDIINCLQGVFIFIVIGCQPQILTAVKRLWCWRRHGSAGTAMTMNHHSSSSQGMPSMGDTITNNSITNTTKSVPLETNC